MNFTKTLHNIYNCLYESETTNKKLHPLIYKACRMSFIAQIKDALQHTEYPLHTLYSFYDLDYKPIPDYYIDTLLKDKKCSALLQLFLNKNNVGGMDNIYLYNNLSVKDQELYRHNRSNTIKNSSIIRQDKKAEELYFTKVDDFLCKMYPDFAKNCGEPFYNRYVTDHMKKVLNKDEENDISNW